MRILKGDQGEKGFVGLKPRGLLLRGGAWVWAEQEIHRWEGVADPGGMAESQVQRRESLEVSLCPSRLGGS